MLRIRRVYEEPSPEDGKRVLVDRIWPRGVKKETALIDEWLKDLAPSTELRKWFGHDPARWEEFRRRYLDELTERTDLLENLRKAARGEKLTLLFAAKDVERNNAAVLKELLER